MTQPMTRLSQLVERLRAGGYRITPQRLAILEDRVAGTRHPSVEQLHESVCRRFPTTSLATVYKTVAMMKALGEVLELEFSNGSNRYDGNKPFPHPHLICMACTKILDPEAVDLSGLLEQIGARTGFTIVNHRLDIYGVCSDCRQSAGG